VHVQVSLYAPVRLRASASRMRCLSPKPQTRNPKPLNPTPETRNAGGAAVDAAAAMPFTV